MGIRASLGWLRAAGATPGTAVALDGLADVLTWLEYRVALLVSFPFDESTFDLPEYRQPHRAEGQFFPNIPFVWDVAAVPAPLHRDLRLARPVCAPHTAPGSPEAALAAVVAHALPRKPGDPPPP